MIFQFGVIALVVAAIRLPVNDIVDYTILVVTAIMAFTGVVSMAAKRWLAAFAVILASLISHALLSPPRIEEGHNVFVIDTIQSNGALRVGLPASVYDVLVSQFRAVYPIDQDCSPQTGGCWRSTNLPARVFAFSSDGLFESPRYSRNVSTINFHDSTWLRLDFINDLALNWYNHTSNVQRGHRDPSAWAVLHRWHLTMPWFVMYRFPMAFVGSQLCWQGDLMWEGPNEQFSFLHHDIMDCRVLELDDAGRRLFGLSVRPESLAITLHPSAWVRLLQIADFVVEFATVVLIMALLIRVRWRPASAAITLVGLAACVIFLSDASFFGGLRYHDGGDDGLTYEGYARKMLQYLVQGDLFNALRGEESIYYFSPGLRYLRVIEKIIFGATNFGYLSLLLAFPLLIFALFRRFLPVTWATLFVLVFILTPIGLFFGSNFFLYIQFSSRGYADPAAFIVALGGIVMLVDRYASFLKDRDSGAFFGSLLLAIAVCLRPNLVLFASVWLTGWSLAALWRARFSQAFFVCIGFSPIFLMALHNWYFGAAFIPFGSNANIPEIYVMPPSAYFAAARELFTFDIYGESLTRAANQIAEWLSGPRELRILIPLHAVAVAIIVKIALFGLKYDVRLRWLAWATVTQHAIALCYISINRYHFLTWLLTALLVLVWLRKEAIPLFMKKFPMQAASLGQQRWFAITESFIRVASRAFAGLPLGARGT